jgi:DNA-binding NarL/FixJ family response regulator
VETSPHNPKNLWLVEDSPVFRSVVLAWIRSQNEWLCTGEFSDAQSMMDRLSGGETPDLILLDLELPGLSGVQALRKIRAVCPDLPVLVLTAHAEESHVREAVRAGASGYLLKSTNQREFFESLGEILAGGAPLDPVVGRILLEHVRETPDDAEGYWKDFAELSPRENEALRLLSLGKPKKQIADTLSLSIHTVDTHIRNIYRKLGVRSNTEALSLVFRRKRY